MNVVKIDLIKHYNNCSIMLSLQIISDIHLEKWKKIPNIPITCPNIALLGDIGAPKTELYQEFIHACHKRYENVFLLAGNHEYHGHTLKEIDEHLHNFTKKYSNVHFLQNSSRQIEGFKIVGTTLWSKIDANIFPGMYGKSIKTTVEEIHQSHDLSVKYIAKELSKAQPTIVLSHHCPLYNYKVAGPYYEHALHSAFFNNLDYMMQKPLVGWGWGHLHYNSSHTININGWSIKLMSNQVGNPLKNTRFDPWYSQTFRLKSFLRK